MNKVLAFDLGRKSLGIAKSDVLGIAHGLENFKFNDGAFKVAISHAIEIIKKEEINTIVIGLALNMDGSESISSKCSRKFAEELLKLNPKLEINFIDERLTTILATNRLLEADISRSKRKKVIDMLSAVAILETYLAKKNDERRNNKTSV